MNRNRNCPHKTEIMTMIKVVRRSSKLCRIMKCRNRLGKTIKMKETNPTKKEKISTHFFEGKYNVCVARSEFMNSKRNPKMV